MHSIRRVALRSVATAARAAVPKAPASQFAKNMVVKQSAVSMARYFSQSVRMMDESNTESQVTEQPQGSTGTSTQARGQEDLPNGIWVRNFVFDVNEDHLKEMFAKFGNVMDVHIVRDPRGLSRGFGFVYMETEEARNKAIEELNGSFWHGRRVHMANATGRRREHGGAGSRASASSSQPSEPTPYLYIGNIPYEATDAELNRMFRGLDNLEDVRVAVDRVTGFPRGFAHADFTDVEAAKKAFEKLSGLELGGRPLRVDYAASTSGRKTNKTGGRKQQAPRE